MSDIELPKLPTLKIVGWYFSRPGITKIDVWAHGGEWEPLVLRSDAEAAILADREKRAQAAHAYAVHFPDQQREELVHDLDDLLEDMTNYEHTVTPLFATEASNAERQCVRLRKDASGVVWVDFDAPNGVKASLSLTNVINDKAERSKGFTVPAMQSALAALATKQAEAPTASNAERADDYVGWYCAHCQRGVDGSEVTFREQHTECGRVITNDRPPSLATQQEAQPQAVARWNWNTSSLEWLVPYRSEFHLKPLFFAARAAQQATGERG